MLPEALGFGVAIGAGLLIGLDRERRKGQGAGRNAAGIRSFSVAALAGAVAQWLQQPLLVVVGAALVLVLVALAYARSRSDDPGVTTELALFVTYLIGVLAMREPALAAGIAATLALLLAMREGLHRFATAWLGEGELHDAMLLAALTLVVLPLTPAEPVEWLAGLAPRRLVLVTALILAVQAVGHVAARVAGARAGLALAGLFSGFVSSTATIASFGARARRDPAVAAPCEAGAMLSTAATWLQALVLLVALAPALAAALAPAAIAAAVVAAATGVWRARRRARSPDGDEVEARRSDPRAADSRDERAPPQDEAGDARRADPRDGGRGPLRLREAALLAALLVGVGLVIGWAERWLGERGVLAGAALGALADAHASVATLAGLHAAGDLSAAVATGGVLLAITTNAVSRSVVAGVAGGAGYALRIALSLAASTATGWAVAAVFGGLGTGLG
ncbi:MAG: MgtC/SapB family protein [Burkholderiales bacterium]|nr:MgtC/SapB family protein [Burkholderiales bacterium]